MAGFLVGFDHQGPATTIMKRGDSARRYRKMLI
jgi:hypothetical protein